MHHFYDFGNQRGDGWESDLIAYYARQFKVKRLDLGLLELDDRPASRARHGTGMSIHPYVLANYVTLGDRPYLGTLGAGLSTRFQLPFGHHARSGRGIPQPRLSQLEGLRERDASKTAIRSSAFSPARVRCRLLAGLSLAGAPRLTKDTASYKPYAYNDFTAEFALPYSFTAPAFAQTERAWTVAPFVGFSFTPYNQPDPIVDPSITRLDRQWRAGATLDMIFYQEFRLRAAGAVSAHDFDGVELPHARSHLFRRTDDPVLMDPQE